MNVILEKVLHMGLGAIGMIVAVMVLRVLLQKVSKNIRCLLWLLVGIRLVCPFSVERMFRLFPDENASIANTAAGQNIRQITKDFGSRIAGGETFESYVAVIVWCSGILLMMLYALYSYAKLYRNTRESIQSGDGTWICDRIDTPFILGIIHPRIFLPSTEHVAQNLYVIAHERAHLARHDHWWKPLGFAILTVYWWNPFVWLAYILFCKDIELACDEKVVRTYDIKARKAYSAALLECSVRRTPVSVCPLAFGEVGVRQRVKAVLRYKKPVAMATIVALVLCVLVAFCFMTDPKSAQGYSDVQLTKMALDYYTSHNNITKSDKMHAVIDHETEDGDQQLVTIWIYEDAGDEEGARGATHAWYTVDRKTAKGYEETTFEDVDLTE